MRTNDKVLLLLAGVMLAIVFSSRLAPLVPRPVPLPPGIRIRLVCLKHSKEHMADGDADLAIAAVNKAKAKGLKIKNVGNHYINRDGKRERRGWYMWPAGDGLDKLEAFIADQAKLEAEPGDTLVVFTIGHGFPDGSLANLGQRSGVLDVLAKVSKSTGQRILWWQLSCHATAKLPPLPADTSGLSIYCSSPAEESSAAGVQGRLMEKVFLTMAEGKQDYLTGGQFRQLLEANRGRGTRLLFTPKDELPLFGNH